MTENKIVSQFFLHPVLPNVYGEPSYITIYDTKQKLRDNASHVPSTLGGGKHGLLALTMPPAEYHGLTGHHWVNPAHPGGTPVIVQGTTQIMAKNIMTQYEQSFKN